MHRVFLLVEHDGNLVILPQVSAEDPSPGTALLAATQCMWTSRSIINIRGILQPLYD
jgi:hypothetical protein